MRRIGYAIKRKIRYMYMRNIITMRNKINHQMNRSVVTDLDLIAQDAIRKAIWEKDSTLLRCENVRYVKVPSKKIYVILENHYALIANSVYSYRFYINEEVYNRLCEIFDNVTEKRAKAIDNDVYNGVKSNIKSILKEF